MSRKTLKQFEAESSTLDRISDKATKLVGSWKFIVFEIFLITVWMSINTYEIINRVDPYPFVFLNLMLALISVLTMPFILMSQNREEKRDRLRDDADYEADLKSEEYIKKIFVEVEELKRETKELKAILEKKNEVM